MTWNPPDAADERRQRAVDSLGVQVDHPEERFDRITRLAHHALRPADGHHHRARRRPRLVPGQYGLDVRRCSRDQVLCGSPSRAGPSSWSRTPRATRSLRHHPAVVRPRPSASTPATRCVDPLGNVVGTLALYDVRSPACSDADLLLAFDDMAAWAQQELVASTEMTQASAGAGLAAAAGPVRVDDWDIAGICLPSLAVGGDFYDYGVTDRVAHLGLGDVMGKGTGAALVGAGVRSALRGTRSGGQRRRRPRHHRHPGRAQPARRPRPRRVVRDAVRDGRSTSTTAGCATSTPACGLCLLVRADGARRAAQRRRPAARDPAPTTTGPSTETVAAPRRPAADVQRRPARPARGPDGLVATRSARSWPPTTTTSRCCAESRPHRARPTALDDVTAVAVYRAAGRAAMTARRQAPHPGDRRADGAARRQLRRLALAGLGQLGRLVDRGPAGHGRDLQPRRLRCSSGSACGGSRTAAQPPPPAPEPDRRRASSRPTTSRSSSSCDTARGRHGHPLPAPHLGPRRRQPPRDARGGRGGGHRVDHPVGRLGGHAAPRQGRQPQQRARRRPTASSSSSSTPTRCRCRSSSTGRSATSATSRWGWCRPRSTSYNVPDDDPLGSQAPLFYGPIQAGKDGWNAAFFCGSNAVIRREALMQVGVARLRRRDGAARLPHALLRPLRCVRKALRHAPADDRRSAAALDATCDARSGARAPSWPGATALFDVTYALPAHASRRCAASMVDADLDDPAGRPRGHRRRWPPDRRRGRRPRRDEEALRPAGARATGRRSAPIESVQAAARRRQRRPARRGAGGDADGDHLGHRGHGHLHAACTASAGSRPTTTRCWPSGSRPRTSARCSTQRLRWAQGTDAGAVAREPAAQKRLSLAAAAHVLRHDVELPVRASRRVVYLTAPVLYLVFGVLPVQALSSDFFIRLVPFLVINQLAVHRRGRRATDVARAAVLPRAVPDLDPRRSPPPSATSYLGRPLDFAVTPKEQAEADRPAVAPGPAAARSPWARSSWPPSSASCVSRSGEADLLGTDAQHRVGRLRPGRSSRSSSRPPRYRGFQQEDAHDPASSVETTRRHRRR